MCAFGQELGMPVWLGQELVTPTTLVGLGQELVTPTTLRFLISLFLR
jgi:hypothetical protein